MSRVERLLEPIINEHRDTEQRLSSRLEYAIVDVLSREMCGGQIYVQWGVYQSGKSCAAQNAAIRLQKEREKVVMFQHGWDFTFKTKLRDWLRVTVSIPDDGAEDRTVMILDHADCLIMRHGEQGLVDGLREIKMPVLIMVNSWERALELRKAGCELLGEPGFGRWTEDELNDLFKTFSPVIQDKSSASMLGIMGAAVISYSPGILFSEPLDPGRQEVHLKTGVVLWWG